RDRYQLHVARDIARDEQPFDVRGDIELSRIDSAPLGEGAAEARSERRALMLSGVEEERIAFDRAAVAERHALEPGALSIQSNDSRLYYRYIVMIQASLHGGRQPGRPVGEEQHVVGPLTEHQSQSASLVVAAAVGRDPTLPPLPAIAIRAVMDALAVQGLDALNRREVVDHPGRQEQGARPDR